MMTLPTEFTHFKDEDFRALAEQLQTLNEVDLSDYLETLAPADRLGIFRLLDKDKAADVFATFEPAAQTELIALMDDKDSDELLARLESDDLVDVLGEMPANLVSKALRQFDTDRRRVINDLLHYPEDTVGSFMTVDYLHVHEGSLVSDCLTAVRASELSSETLNHIYVTDHHRVFQGVVPLWRVIQADPGTQIQTLMEDSALTLQTLEDQEEAAIKFKRYGVSALPVVDSEKRMVGIVTADDMAHVLEDEADEDYQLIQGLVPSTKSYLDTSVWELSRQRVVWLLVMLISATFTAMVIQRYEVILATSVALTAYIPMLMDSGGNSGSQSSSLITRSIALGELELRDTPKVLWKELRVGMMAGGLLAAVNILKVFFLDREPIGIAVVVSLTLAATVIIAKQVGGILPLLAKRVGTDPAIMAGPLVTTIVDTLALIVYFQFARLIL